MSLYVREQGSGEPLVLMHGLFGSLENMGGVSRLLSEHYRVISIDLPNHGRSDHTPAANLDIFVEEISRWLDEIQLGPAHFLGHSLGGKIAMELALRSSARVKRLVVADIAPSHYTHRHQSVFEGLGAVDLTQLSTRQEADKILTPFVPELPVRSFLLKNLIKTDEGFSWRMNLAVLQRDYTKLIAANSHNDIFEGKTLFLKGGASDYIEERHREDILSRFPQTQLKIIPETGHWLHAEKPELFANIVNRFLKEG